MGLGVGALLAPPFGCSLWSDMNVVLINADDLGWKDLGCYGNRFHDTRNLDALCSSGVKFTNAYAAAAVCSPTRAAIMTGRYPARTGVTDWIQPPTWRRPASDDPDVPEGYVVVDEQPLLCPASATDLPLCEVTIAEVLKEAGYATGHIGKWHLGTPAFFPEEQGFDVNVGGSVRGQPPSWLDPYESPGLALNIEPRKKGEHLTRRLALEAVRFVREHQNGTFFLNLWTYAVHQPVRAVRALVAKYEAMKLPKGQSPAYASMVEALDRSVGAVLDVLDELGLSDRTLIVFTSDNGGSPHVTSNAPLRDGKGTPYEGAIRIPQIIRWPGLTTPGSVCDVPVTSVDLFPTICEATGKPLPPDVVIDGLSLAPLLRGESTLRRTSIFWHYPHYWNDHPPHSIVRHGDWKMIRRYQGKRHELFDLAKDPREKNDLSRQMRAKLAELDEELDGWLEKTGAALPEQRF